MNKTSYSMFASVFYRDFPSLVTQKRPFEEQLYFTIFHVLKLLVHKPWEQNKEIQFFIQT